MSDRTASPNAPVPPAALPAVPSTVYVDCTETLLAGLNTGIQRVVRNITIRLPVISQVLGIPCVAVFAKGGRLWVLDDLSLLSRPGRSGALGKARDRFVRIEAALQSAVETRLARWPGLQRLALAAWNAPRQALKQGVRLLTRGRAARQRGFAPATLGPADLLLLPDAFWRSDIVAALEAGAADNAVIVPLIHDVIPLTHPQFFAPPLVLEFRTALERLLRLSGAVLAVSAATQAQVQRHLRTRMDRRLANLPAGFAYSGADLPATPAAGGGTIRSELLGLRDTEYFLLVGTLEPRKGQLGVLDAFEALWRAGETARLVLAGRIGWGFREIVRRLEQSPFRGTRLIAVHDATDGDLAWLYRHAAAVIVASHEEGFGLPLVEAMHLNVPVLANDIPVFREVGRDYPVYFRLEQPGALAEALQTQRDRTRRGERPEARPWPTWDGAAPDVIRAAVALFAQAQTQRAANAPVPPTVFVDCTETLIANLSTGIQRVVRNVVTRLPAISQALGVPCVPVFAQGGRLWVLDDLSALSAPGRSGTVGKARDRFVRVEAAFQGWVERRLARWPGLQRFTLAAWDAPRRTLKRAVRRLTRSRAAGQRHLTPARPGSGDILLLADAFWTSEIVPTLEGGAASGAMVLPVIYDIIPITHPQFFGPRMVHEFQDALDRLLRLASGLLTDSAATLDSVRHHVLSRLPAPRRDLPGIHWYPGADLAGPSSPLDSAIRPALLALAGHEYFLMVGTLEPRKGQLAVLDAFEALWSAGEAARLVLAGRIGWRFAEIVQRIEHSPHAGSRLVALHDATDAEVDWLYRHATAVILASHAEGFGLPLVEAMHHGVPVVASDIPVFHEVGGGYPVYFKPGEPGALDAALTALRERLRAGWRPQPRPWPTWDESAPDLIRKALALRERVRGSAAR